MCILAKVALVKNLLLGLDLLIARQLSWVIHTYFSSFIEVHIAWWVETWVCTSVIGCLNCKLKYRLEFFIKLIWNKRCKFWVGTYLRRVGGSFGSSAHWLNVWLAWHLLLNVANVGSHVVWHALSAVLTEVEIVLVLHLL